MALDLKGENNGVIILSFDINSEKFRKLALPDAFMDAYLYSSKSCLALFKQKLAFITSGMTEGIYFQYSIWVMREYGVIESWNKLFVVPLVRVALCIDFTEYGSLLTCETKNEKYKFSLIDIETLHDKHLGIQHPSCVATFMESLALLEGANMESY